ncbi:hypothetical protein [Hymenobacter cellulosivorans]|uniref:Uncharacterized protein n=1 Tax=Hymenobacter cellulosivorans TaxID=2932249 RepID=A0ABY4F4X0_9BACT|nr:hypothetical protein [Hymenobacter cellulosivorans]UOQ51715.1 hypothetical protein MUN80_18360 [Hymenobacter cellulosivorans]
MVGVDAVTFGKVMGDVAAPAVDGLLSFQAELLVGAGLALGGLLHFGALLLGFFVGEQAVALLLVDGQALAQVLSIRLLASVGGWLCPADWHPGPSR